MDVIGFSNENAAAARLVRSRKNSQTPTIWRVIFRVVFAIILC
jgi:uncharacterized membrane protein YagU involved in acid resistance